MVHDRMTRWKPSISTSLLLTGLLACNLQGASDNLQLSVEVLLPLSLQEVQGMDFGTLVAGVTPNTFTLTTDGNVITSGGSYLYSGQPQAGLLQVGGNPHRSYDVSLPTTTLLQNGLGSVLIAYGFNVSGGLHRTLDAAGEDTLQLGATLALLAYQGAGTYSGSLAVTLHY